MRLLFLLLLTLPSAAAFAHGVPDMCDARQDIVAQCGEFHTCRTRPEVSEDIGVCEGEFEEERFLSCDRRRDDDDCGADFVCRTGTVDPNIGACIERPPITYLDPAPDLTPDPGPPIDPEPACTSAPTQAPAAPLWLLVIALLARRRRS